jgi:hypothetical protein
MGGDGGASIQSFDFAALWTAGINVYNIYEPRILFFAKDLKDFDLE